MDFDIEEINIEIYLNELLNEDANIKFYSI
jgi:hypothetical protein